MSEPATNYQELAEEYARHRRVHPGVVDALVSDMISRQCSEVLEVGCGSGNYLEVIRNLTGAAVHGIDPSSAMLDRLRERLPDAPVQVARAESLPFADRSLDSIYSVDVIHHVGDRRSHFRECVRTLRPGGRVVTVTDSPHDLERRVPLTSHFPETLEHERRRYPSIDTLRSDMESVGFRELVETRVELRYALTDVSGFHDKAYSALHLISDAEHAQGMKRLESDLRDGAIEALSLYTLLWGVTPS